MRIIIFGGSGFLGKNLASFFLQKKHYVTIFDKKKCSLKHKNLKKIQGDIINFHDVIKAVKGNDFVYNFAGISDIEESIKKPRETVKINILGTINTLEASLKSNIKKYLFASSIYVLSSQGGFYKTSKKSSELYIDEYNKQHKLNYTIMRFGSIYGVEADKRNGISKILYNFKKKGILEYGGTKKAKRRFIHINDAIKATADLIDRKFNNKIVNILGKRVTKITYLMRYLSNQLKLKKSKHFYKNKPQLGHYETTPFTYEEPKSINYYRKDSISLEDGIKKLVNFKK